MRITGRQLGAYLRANRDWIGVNDAYNLQQYGMTTAQLNTIGKAISSLRGICGDMPSLAAINRELANVK